MCNLKSSSEEKGGSSTGSAFNQNAQTGCELASQPPDVLADKVIVAGAAEITGPFGHDVYTVAAQKHCRTNGVRLY